MQLAKYARVFALVKLCTLFFYLGYRNAVNESSNGSKVASSTSGSPGLNSTSFEFKPECTTPTEMATSLKQQIEDRVESELSERRRNKAPVHQDNNRGPPAWNSDLLFPHQTVEYAVGAIIVSKDDLMDSFDLFGVPRKKTTGNEDAIMIYNTEKALPAAESLRKIAKEGTDGVIGEAGSISDAVGQCDSLNVMMLPVSPNDATCTVVIGNFESYQVGDRLS
ncbi:hypothetical protein THAOC_04332 [Thalassiosira oceanica]|uniref:Uncharacterized protein n=1 Tax=Thalassiosira oceanica TaxID=159749 RepID=K0TA86_THAOC|nr:hypothetical protein THAOC_04332 [Thalassiosira oceanica]|eukprot:EJK74019.1 hypothetical protein THAOC_04332 [Thalassiosira oceanica]